MTKKKKQEGIFGVTFIIDPCVQLETMVSFLEARGVSGMIESDWEKLQLVANRCTMEGAELALRFSALLQLKGS